jgi:hypothetical protein
MELITFATLAMVLSSARSMPPQGNCSIGKLAIPPQWISTVELNTQTKELLIVDPKGHELLTFDVQDGKMAKVPLSNPPESVNKIQGGFLIRSGDDATVFGAAKRLANNKGLGARVIKGDGSSHLATLYANWVTKDSTFIGFGALDQANLAASYDPSRGFELGFLRGKINAASGQFSDIELLDPTEDNDWYLIGFPYFAATSDGLFYIRMTGHAASLVRVKTAGHGKDALQLLSLPIPGRFLEVPHLKTRNTGPSSTEARFKEIEQSRMISGLFGQGNMLYVLAREPNSTGGTQWLLFQVDPDKGKLLGEVRLPTTSPHLVVVPGLDYWYLIERGTVRGWGLQVNDTVVRVPVDWITNPITSRLNASSFQDVSCVDWKP